MTNFHVIFKAERVKIQTRDGKSYSADIVMNYDEKLDLGVLKIDQENTPALPLGDSDDLFFWEKLTCPH